MVVILAATRGSTESCTRCWGGTTAAKRGLGVAQHKRRDRTGAEDANDELYKKALRVKQLVCHVIECILEMRLTIRLCSFLTSLRRHLDYAAHRGGAQPARL